MKTLLISPRSPNTFWSLNHSMRFLSSKATFPPLGLLTVAAMLPGDWDKKLVDMNVTTLNDEDIMRADVVFISAMIVQKESTLDVINRCKKLGKKIVAGGPLFMSFQDEFDYVDHLIIGEAELVLPLFLDDLKQGKAKHAYSSEEYPDLSKNPPPIPLWSLIKFKNYASMSIQYSRGCPFDCEFCDIVVMNGRIPRTKTPERVISELEALYDAGWRGRVFIVDDNFIGNKSKAINMSKMLTQWQSRKKFPFTFSCQASIDLAANQELMDKMREANFYQVFIGIESPSLDSLNECGKDQNVRVDMEKAIITISNNGMQVMAGFIVGFDNDPEDIFQRQIDFIQKSGIVAAMVAVLGAPPKTRLWYRLKDENRIVDEYSGDNIIDGKSNIVPLIGEAKLQEGYKKILTEVYSKKNYYNRINTFLKEYRPSVVNRVGYKDISTLIKVFWKLGFLSNQDRFLFWKIILKTLFTNTKAMPEVVAYTIYGVHFHSIVKSM